jgi:hypothetical protein
VPDAGDDVVIKSGHNVVVNSFEPTAFCDTLTIESGAIFRLGGFLNQSGAVLNYGTLTWSSGTFEGAGVITNDGILNINDVLGFFPLHRTAADIVNTPGKTINWNGGTLEIDSDQTLTNHGIFNLIGNSPCAMNIVNTGAIIKPAGALDFSGAFDNQANGSVSGQGTLTFSGAFSNTGNISPGLSPGNLALNRTSGVQVHDLNIEIASNAGPGIGHDRLQSANAVNISGNLTVSLLGGFEPDEGATYTIMTYASRTGVFAGVTPDCWTVTYGATSATVTYEPSYWSADEDGDGYGSEAYLPAIIACTQPPGYVAVGGDCDDTNASVNPGQTEICGNGLDEDCDGFAQADTVLACGDIGTHHFWWFDTTDICGYGMTVEKIWYQFAPPQSGNYIVQIIETFYDAIVAYKPQYFGCDTANWICLGAMPGSSGDFAPVYLEGGTPYYFMLTGPHVFDNDVKAFRIIGENADNDPYSVCEGDCDDTNPNIYPGATEICDGLDNDCDGQIDEGVLSTFYADTDNDGYGNAAQSLQSCTLPSGYVSNDTDCNDDDASIYPGSPEICDGADNDCDSQTDEDNVCDGDGDGYTIAQGDCNDDNAAINPGATETCNGIDDNCNGQIDEGALLTFYADGDGDGFGDASQNVQGCTAPSGFVNNASDCDDSNPAIHPDAAEICNNIDDDCDGQIDEGAPDSDGDGICNALDNCPNTYNPNQADNEGDGIGDVCDNNDDNDPKLDHQDCAPFDPNIYPGAPEICGNLIDDDCDNKIDEPLGIQTVSEQDVLCNGQATGSITVTGTCGLPPYTYLWTNGETTATISNLAIGSYKVTVTDAQGLTKTKNHNITQPSALNVNMTAKDVKCFGGSDGTATASPSGGKSPYTYAWSNGGTTKTISGLSVGAYIVTVTDANGCTKIGGIEVNQPTELSITDISYEPDVQPNKYKITVTAAGGTPYDDGYRYRRCNSSGTGCTGWQVSNVLVNASAGTYLVRVKDKNACEASQLVTVGGAARGSNENVVLFENQNVESRSEPTSEFEIRLYPNPASTEINLFVSGEMPDESVFEITDFTGKTIQRLETQPTPGELTQLDVSALPTGTYLMRWSSGGKTLATKVFLVIQD